MLEEAQTDGRLEILKSCNLKRFSTLRSSCIGDLYIIKDPQLLKVILPLLKKNYGGYRVLGLGSNVVLPETSELPFIKLEIPFNRDILGESQSSYTLPASVALRTLTNHAIKYGHKGWEYFTGIPGQLGGAVFMNAGTKLGEIGTLVEKVKLFTQDGREKVVYIDSDISFSYRKNHFCAPGDVIYEVTIKHFGDDPEIGKIIQSYMGLRQKTQPLDKKTCGCVFKNISAEYTAGRLIDLLGLKGLRVGDFQVSQTHGNFIENIGNGHFTDFISLVRIIQGEIKLHFGFNLELEVIV